MDISNFLCFLYSIYLFIIGNPLDFSVCFPELSTTTTTTVTPCAFTRNIGSKILCLLTTAETPQIASNICLQRSSNYFVASNGDEKTAITQFLVDASNQILGGTTGVVYGINGFEQSPNNWTMFDSSEPLISEMIPPPSPADDHCLSMSDVGGAIVPFRVNCNSATWFICQSTV